MKVAIGLDRYSLVRKGPRHTVFSWGKSGALVRVLRERMWALAATFVLLTLGMAYSLLWGPVVRHHSYWITPGDMWSAYRSAHFIGWGYVGGIYSAGTGLVTFPGLLFLLAPIAMLTGALKLTECFPYFVPHPTAWLVLGPAEVLISSASIFAADAMARHLGVSSRRRALLAFTEGAVLWNVSITWGHPEDALAVGLAMYALLSAMQKRWTRCGWLFGAAIATQPLVILIMPILFALGGRRQAIGLLFRGLLPGAVLLIGPVASQFHSTVHAIVDQPNYPVVDHATPWTALAPRLGGDGVHLAVAAGPGRILALLLACGLGVWATRSKESPRTVLWAVALALALRCFTESVMDSFYVWPALAFILVAASTSFKRLIWVGSAAICVTVVSDWRLGELPWWLLVSGLLAFVLVSGYERTVSRRLADVPMIQHDAPTVAAIGALERPLAGAVR